MNEFRQRSIVCLGGIFLLLAAGCGWDGFSDFKSLPAPIAAELPYQIDNCRRKSVWGGDNFELADDGVVHYIVMEGIIAPKPGQRFYLNSRRQLVQMLGQDLFRVQVVGRDSFRREVGFVFVGDTCLNLEMLKQGLAWYDGSEFEGWEEYLRAEEEARSARVGLWRQLNPIHPDDFVEEQ